MSRLPVAIAACIALVTVAGCSDGDDAPDASAATTAVADQSTDTTDTTAPTSASATTGDTTTPAATTVPVTTAPAATTVPDAVIDIDNQPGEGVFEGAVDDTTLECAAADGVWTASGTVTNSTEVSVGYRIFVSFLDDAGETVALVEADDDLDALSPGEARDWSVSFESGLGALDCVPRVERRPT